MKSFDEIYNYVKNTLSEKRFYHSECVMERAIEYARIYGANEEYAKFAGILHDIAKEIPKEERIEVANKYGLELDEIEIKAKGLIHAKLGAKIAKVDFDMPDEVCEAIKYHTTGKADMSLLEKIIYLADFTGKDRNFTNTEFLYNLCKKDIDKALLYSFKYSINERLEEEKLIHLDTISGYNFMVKNI